MNKRGFCWLSTALVVTSVHAQEQEKEVQDMSDPLAIYTQVGAGVTNAGLNLKIGKTYDSGKEGVAAMNFIEVKGFGGETLGLQEGHSDSVDSIRFRNFTANMTNGRGAQIDVQYDLQNEMGLASYSLIQALPTMGPLTMFPLAGAGVAFGNNVMGDDGQKISGYSVPGTFAVAGMYTKIDVTDKLWINYNPMWMKTLSGSEMYMQHGFENHSEVLAHEVALSYQVNPRFNVRYFANWSNHTELSEGNHRVEFNYQL
ncbi:hypothetical protein [Vibrio sp. SCSIO 43136]|uniref:hypothetical protein n=1 Tax=Vibrio sp. SCSIO 43136 TaxID=2819101 RepID=UPI002074C807|nr:hypothetical protein [Vibrio sp. SCSIO 43136]USD68312.1 hypothetical protein J4N39_21420 [Vibrio sp. SCSIO 43136]